MKSSKITALILTKNEALRLPLIFENLKGFAEIMVFDADSTDNTEEVCQQYGVRYVKRPDEFKQADVGALKFSVMQIETPYLLYVNCSHYYPARLLEEFKRVAEEGKYHAVYHDHLIYTYARVVHRPFFRRRSSATNFYRVDAINWANSKIHNEAPIEVPDHLKWIVPARDEYAVQLFRDYDVKKAESNHSYYSDVDALQRFEAGIRTNLRCILWKPLRNFLYQYLRCGSILCGIEGFIYSILYAQLELNIQLKLWELQRGFNSKSLPEIHIAMRKQFHDNNY